MLNDRCMFVVTIVVLVCLLLVAMLWASLLGSVDISIQDILFVIEDKLLHGSKYIDTHFEPIYEIVWYLRLPRVILSALIGGGLAICGVVMQAIVKNPLADPYILGVSSGASLGATAAIMLGIGSSLGENYIGVCAFIGALFISLAVVFMSNIGSRSNSMKLLLAGMALSAVCSALSSFIVYLANNQEGMQTITFWLMGSTAGANWNNLAYTLPIIVISILIFISQSRILNLMLLGDDVAVTLGRDLHVYRQVYLLLSSLVVGFAVYAAGMIGFVGLIIPHVVRIFSGTDHYRLLPYSALVGAIFLVVADCCCRIIIPRTEIPIGILISLIGAPTFIYLMVKKSYGFGGKN